MLHRWFNLKSLFAAIAVLAVGAVVAAFVVVRFGEEEHGNEIREALDRNPALLNNRMLPIAAVAEKLGKDGGEASGEILNGPSQEEYQNRAYPRQYIGNAQVVASQHAYLRADSRANTAAGQLVLRKALGAATPGTWGYQGPRNGIQAAQTTYTGTKAFVSGRTTALAIANSCTERRCILYAATAGGGVWKTNNALAARPHWWPIGQYDIPTTSIGSLYLSPSGDLYVGTGEANGSSDNEAGRGLYKSTDGGKTFAKVSTTFNGKDFTMGRGIGAVAVDPSNPMHMYVGTVVARHGSSSVNGGRFTPPHTARLGVYESKDGGSTWDRSLAEAQDPVVPKSSNGLDYFRGGISKITFDPNHPGTVYASMFDYGLYRRVGHGRWQRIYTIHTPGDPATSLSNRVEFALARLANGKTRIYLGDSTYYNDSVAGFLRTDDGTAADPKWTELSDPTDGTPGYGSYNFCEGQCYYDMVVASPPGHPNQVFLSGAMNYPELQAFGGPGNSNGRAVVRSTDAGVHFTDMTNDAQPRPNGLHPDHHAIAFVPRTGAQQFFTASDGGVVHQSGPFVDKTGQCAKRGLSGAKLADCMMFLKAIPTYNNNQVNMGLDTLQFQSASTTDNAQVIQAGTQDNGTWESDRIQGWVETVGGDGGQSDFNPKNNAIRYHSYYAPQHDVSFHNGNPKSWDWISDPLLNSGETASFYTPLRADPVNAGTVYDGLQHIWRTTDNGGPRKYLQQHCNELRGDFTVQCGDWQPLGGDQGDLSGTYWGGNTDVGNYVVAIERAATDKSTLWAATRYGRVFISTNANAANPADVTYQRIDKELNLPRRFVSGISIDPQDPYHVWISYSGYQAYRPGGHVYEVTWNPNTQTGTKKNLNYDLGDQPVTDVVYAPSTGALFAATDWGVMTLAQGGNSWVATQGIPPVAVYGLTLSPSGNRLLAATHGRGIWELSLS